MPVKRKMHFIILSFALPLFANSPLTPCDQTDMTLARESIAKQRISTEIELDLTPALVQIFETTDGTVNSLLTGLSISEFSKTFSNEHIEPSTNFSSLDPAVKVRVLTYIWQLKTQDATKFGNPAGFPMYRIVEGLILKDEIVMLVDSPLTFRGNNYEVGQKFTLKCHEFFDRQVEWSGSAKFDSSVGVEIHMFDDAKHIRRLLVDSWAFQRNYAGFDHVYLHLPVNIRKHRFEKSPVVESFKITIFKVFADIVATLQWLKFNLPIEQSRFSHAMDRSGLANLFQSLAMRAGDMKYLFKSLTGFRFQTGYKNANLMGAENRTATSFIDPDFVFKYSEASYYRMLHRDYFFNVENIIEIFKDYGVTVKRLSDGDPFVEFSANNTAVISEVIAQMAVNMQSYEPLAVDLRDYSIQAIKILDFFYNHSPDSPGLTFRKDWKEFSENFPEMKIFTNIAWYAWKTLLGRQPVMISDDVLKIQFIYLQKLQTIKDQFDKKDPEKTRDKIFNLVSEFVNVTGIYSYFTTAYSRLDSNNEYDAFLKELLK